MPTLQKLNEAVHLLDSIFNSPSFAAKVRGTQFNTGNFNLSAEMILQLILTGMDSLANKPKDYSVDCRVSVYDKYKGGDEFGNTSMSGVDPCNSYPPLLYPDE